MTHDKWVKLTNKQKRIKAAEVRGWKIQYVEDNYYRVAPPSTNPLHGIICLTDTPGSLGRQEVPDSLNDLNAMHEAEMAAMGDSTLKSRWQSNMILVCGSVDAALSATAAQRAEAFVLTMEPE